MKTCATFGIIQAFASDNNPKENADTERLMPTLKEELRRLREWTSALELERALTAWGDWYNTRYLHLALGYERGTNRGQLPSERSKSSTWISKPLKRATRNALREFEHDIAVQKPFTPNDGDQYRNGEHIATRFVESTINQVVSTRFVTHQSMRWSKRGAHLVLLGRTRPLNDGLRSTFKGWYPGLRQAA